MLRGDVCGIHTFHSYLQNECELRRCSLSVVMSSGTGCEGETLRANKNETHTERIEIYNY